MFSLIFSEHYNIFNLTNNPFQDTGHASLKYLRCTGDSKWKFVEGISAEGHDEGR